MDYLLVLPVQFCRTGPDTVRTEGAFAEHLRMLRARLPDSIDFVHVVSPDAGPGLASAGSSSGGEIIEESARIRWTALHPAGVSRLRFWLVHARRILAVIRDSVDSAEVVHAGISADVMRPIEFAAIFVARRRGKKTVFVVDIDERNDNEMRRSTRSVSLASYLVDRFLYSPLRSLQLKYAARNCDLVLFKGRQLCSDFGGGRPNVKYFLDSAFTASSMITQEQLLRKIDMMKVVDQPVRFAYFGRFVARKGVDHCLRAIALARRLTTSPIEFHLIGLGEQEEALRDLVQELGLQDVVHFHGAVAFGPDLFRILHDLHVLLAAPLTEDTPRSALDAMASGMSIIAYGTYYYEELRESGCVATVPWLDVEGMAGEIADVCEDRRTLERRARASVAFAAANTQEIWLQRRAEWTQEFVGLSVGDPARDQGG